MDSPVVYSIPPLDFAPTLFVASCCCTCEGKCLLLQSATTKNFGGTWGAPGGKLEPSETPHAAALRETKEETGLELEPSTVHFFKTFFVRYPKVDFVYHVFYTNLTIMPKELTLQPREHSAYRWATTQEIKNLPLIPGAYECFVELYGDPLIFS